MLENGQMFPCPVCRQVANLEASVSMESLCDFMEEDEDVKKNDQETFEIGNPLPFHLALESEEIKSREEAQQSEMDEGLINQLSLTRNEEH